MAEVGPHHTGVRSKTSVGEAGEFRPRNDRAPAAKPLPADRSKDDTHERPTRDKSPVEVFRRHPFVVATAVILAVAVVTGAVIWWLHARQYETTDDAFIDARSVSISSQVAGAIVDLPVTDNQLVEAGGVLARIDDRDYKAALDEAMAQVDEAQATLANLAAQIAEQQAKVEQAEKLVADARAALRFAQEENARYQDLLRKGAGTQQRAQQASSDLGQKQAELAAAQANATAAEQHIAVLTTQKQIASARWSRRKPHESRPRSILLAPWSGHRSRDGRRASRRPKDDMPRSDRR